jgi:hypothetical protein
MTERTNGERPDLHLNTVEWGSADPAGPSDGTGPVRRGAGFGLAAGGFVLLVVSQVLPWMSYARSVANQDFPTGAVGRVEVSYANLPFSTEFFDLGWLALFGLAAVALVIQPDRRRLLATAGLGLAAGQFALLVGLTYGILHTDRVYTSTFGNAGPAQISLDIGVYCGYAALVLLAGALLFAGGFWHRSPHYATDEEYADADERGPADLTVAPIPADDPTVWSDRDDHRH